MTSGWPGTTLLFAVIAVYYVIGYRLTAKAYRYLREPNRTRWANPVFDPQNFAPEGESLRREAVRWWRGGGAAVLVLIVLITWWF